MTNLHEIMFPDRRIEPVTSWILIGRASDRATRPGISKILLHSIRTFINEPHLSLKMVDNVRLKPICRASNSFGINSNYRYYSIYGANNTNVDQTARMHWLISVFVVRVWHKQDIAWCDWNACCLLLQTFICGTYTNIKQKPGSMGKPSPGIDLKVRVVCHRLSDTSIQIMILVLIKKYVFF